MFADIGMGVFFAVFVSAIFFTPVNGITILSGVVFSMIPDMDYVVELFRDGYINAKNEKAHRSIFHFPLTYIPVIFVLATVLPVMFVVLLVFCLLGHFLHDTFDWGWGIQWFWPFSEKIFKVEKADVGYRAVARDPIQLEKMVSTKRELFLLQHQYPDFRDSLLMEFIVFIVCGIVLTILILWQ